MSTMTHCIITGRHF